MDIYFRKFGKGKPLIILHGLFGLSDNWSTIGKKLSENFEVYIPDMRNHGQSSRSHEFSHEFMSEDIYELCLNNGLKDCIVIGHSMGGKVAMCLALEHPEIIAKLVVVDIAPKEYFIYDYLRKMIEAIRDTKLNEFNKRTDLEAYILSQVDDIRIAQFLTKNIQRNNRGEFEWKFYAEGIIRNMINMGKAVEKGNLFEKPTLFIKGEKSKFILNEDYALIKEYFSNAEIQIIKNAGHWVHADQPEEFLDRVLNFIL